jgi:hypothetical protein
MLTECRTQTNGTAAKSRNSSAIVCLTSNFKKKSALKTEEFPFVALISWLCLRTKNSVKDDNGVGHNF